MVCEYILIICMSLHYKIIYNVPMEDYQIFSVVHSMVQLTIHCLLLERIMDEQIVAHIMLLL